MASFFCYIYIFGFNIHVMYLLLSDYIKYLIAMYKCVHTYIHYPCNRQRNPISGKTSSIELNLT